MSEARLNISEGSLKALVESLATDGSFRMRASRNPSAALAEFGIHISSQSLRGPIRLAPRSYFKAMLQYLEHGPAVTSFFHVLALLFASRG